MHPLKKFHKKMTVKGGGGWINPYGQHDRKMLDLFLTPSLKYMDNLDANCQGREQLCWSSGDHQKRQFSLASLSVQLPEEKGMDTLLTALILNICKATYIYL